MKRHLAVTFLTCLFCIAPTTLAGGDHAAAEPAEAHGHGPVLVEPGPTVTSVLYADGSVVELETETVSRYICGSDVESRTREDLRQDILRARESFADPQNVHTISAEGLRGSLNIVFNVSGSLPSGASQALSDIATYVEGIFSDPVTVTIDFNMTNMGGGVLGATSSAYAGSVNWSNTRSGLVAGMDADDTIQGFLPSGATIPVRYNASSSTVTDETRCFFTLANYNATIGAAGGTACSMTINTAVSWDYDPSNGVGGSYCFQSVVVHEVGHALGFTSGVDFRTSDIEALDIYRFQRTDGTGDYNPDSFAEFQTTPRTVDFNNLNDDANSDLIDVEYRMSDGSPNQASHFRDEFPPIGIMDPTGAPGETFYPDFFLQSDVDMFDAIGWDFASGDCNGNGILDATEIAGDPSLDCQGDGVLDECQLVGDDCNGNMTPDECDISSGFSDDCNANSLPDDCEMSLNADSGPLSTIGTGSPQSFTLVAPPLAAGNVTLSFTAVADLASSNEDVDVDINGVFVGTVFDTGAEDCPGTPDTDQLIVSAATYNNAVAGGDAVIGMVASGTVNPALCNPDSYISVFVSYESDEADCNGNGTLDECDVVGLILQQPEDQYPCAGGQADFSVSVSGATGYQWFRDGFPLSNGGGISGATTANLVVSGVDAGDEGSYSCEVSIGCLQTVTNAAALQIDAAPVIVSQPAAVSSKCSGNTAQFTVGVDAIVAQYEWRRDGVPLVNDGRISGADTATLSIDDITPADNALYTCFVFNDCGDDLSNASELRVVTPEFTEQPQDACANEGATVQFSVTATSPLTVGYAWRKNGDLLSEQPGHITGTQTDTLTITNVAIGDAGDYSVTTYSSPSPLCFAESDMAALTVGGCQPTCLTPGDMDGDGDYDLADMSEFTLCFEADVIAAPACACANVIDTDSIVDIDDWTGLELLLDGPQ